MAKKIMKMKFENSLVALYSDSVATHMIHSNVQMYTVQWGCWLLAPLEWVAGLGMGTSTARGARFPVPNRSYPAEREPARSSPIHPIARLSGSERLRRSTAKILLALLRIWQLLPPINIFLLNISTELLSVRGSWDKKYLPHPRYYCSFFYNAPCFSVL